MKHNNNDVIYNYDLTNHLSYTYMLAITHWTHIHSEKGEEEVVEEKIYENLIYTIDKIDGTSSIK